MLQSHRDRLESRRMGYLVAQATARGERSARESFETSELEVASSLRHLSVWYARARRFDEAFRMAEEVRECRHLRRSVSALSCHGRETYKS